MRKCGFAESIDCAFLIVATATTVAVEFNTAWHYVHTLSIDSEFGFWLDIAVVGNLDNSTIVHENRTAINPSFWSEDVTIIYLGQHNFVISF